MKSKHLQYFIGKVCTILTVPINRDYSIENPKTYIQTLIKYFTGIIENIDDYGVLIRQLDGDLKSFFLLENIVGISEEKCLNPDEPEDKEIIESLKPVIANQIKSGPLIDPQGMSELMKQIKPAGH